MLLQAERMPSNKTPSAFWIRRIMFIRYLKATLAPKFFGNFQSNRSAAKNRLCFTPPQLKAFTSFYADQICDFPSCFCSWAFHLQEANDGRRPCGFSVPGLIGRGSQTAF